MRRNHCSLDSGKDGSETDSKITVAADHKRPVANGTCSTSIAYAFGLKRPVAIDLPGVERQLRRNQTDL